jgi:ferredoxin
MKTMKEKILTKENLAPFLDELLKTYRVVAPVRSGDYSLYRPLEDGRDICLDYLRPMKSAKEIFFPQNETLFYFNKRTNRVVESPEDEKTTVLFGITPCDLAGIAAQDRIFASGTFKDSYYMRRRSRSILIGIACPIPGETCFCHVFGIDRFASEIADLFFIPLQGRYLVRVNTERGRKLVEYLQEATEADVREAERLAAQPVESKEEIMPLEELSHLLAEEFESPVWDDIARRCIGCAACTFVCPTCHCFDITDEIRRDIGRRSRTWDGCMFPMFTLHASGHNPRMNATQRIRQRILHKFAYFKDNQGIISCTGCGRCVEVCPVNVDIREVLKCLSGILMEASKK